MAEQAMDPDEQRERLAREDEERERRAQADARDRRDPDDERERRDPDDEREPEARADDEREPHAPDDEREPQAPDDERERQAQADDERPDAVADDVDYDALPASEHVSHGEAGADLVDKPGEPDVPAQEEHLPTVATPAAMRIEPEASDTVFVEPPVEPRPRHNRLFGVGIVLLSTILFGALYAGVAALLLGFRLRPDEFLEGFTAFLYAPAFWIPIIVYAVFAILTALLVNRARWWAYTLTSLVVGLLVYAVSVAAVLLLAGFATRDAEGQRVLLVQALTQPVLIAAGFAARETLLWSGLGIAARGRRVVARNRAEREDYERRVARSESVWDDPAGAR